MINECGFYEATGNITGASVGIYMIRTVLCIIFHDKNSTFLPDRTLTQVVHKHPHSKVIIGNCSERSRAANPQTFGMIIDKTQGIHFRKLMDRKKGVKIPLPLPETGCIHHSLVPACVISTIMTFKDRDIWLV